MAKTQGDLQLDTIDVNFDPNGCRNLIDNFNNNMQKLDASVTNKLVIADTLPPISERIKNGFYLQNRDVVRDGLVDVFLNSTSNKISTKVTDVWTVCFKGITDNIQTMSTDGVWYLIGQNINVYVPSVGYVVANTKEVTQADIFPIGTIENNKPFYIVINRNKEDVSISINGSAKSFKAPSNVTSGSLAIGSYGASFNYGENGKFDAYVYNRVLTTEEIKYNFSSMGKNKVQAIEKADGTKYALSALSEDVFFSNGMNLDMAMNQFISWKTLTMGVDGTFPTSKVADWYSDRYSIKGNTVKQLLTIRLTKANITKSPTKVSNDNYMFKNGSIYTLMMYVDELSGTSTVNLNFSGGFAPPDVSLNPTKIGWYTKTFTVNGQVDTTHTFVSLYYFNNIETDKCIISDVMMFEGSQAPNVTSYVPFGLSSVGTTVGGKTCLSYSVNGVTNCFELPQVLSKVEGYGVKIYDTLESVTVTSKVGSIILDGVNTKVNSIVPFYNPTTDVSNLICFDFLTKGLKKVGSDTVTPVVSDKLLEKDACWSAVVKAYTFSGNSANSNLYIVLEKSALGILESDSNTTKAGKCEEWLKNNHITVYFELVQSISQEIKSTFVIGPDAAGNADIKFTGPVLPSAATLDVAQTAQQTSDRLTALENALLLMQSK